MATVIRPLGEILARLPAFDGDPDGPTAGMCFEQYGEFRVPSQPDARKQVVLAELRSLADDLDTAAAREDLAEPWAGPRLAAMAGDLRMIVGRLQDQVAAPPRTPFAPPLPGRWLSLDFDGWYQVRLATGGDPYNDPRGLSGWIFAYAGEPDLDRRLRLRPEGTFLRDAVDPGIAIGVDVRAATLDGQPRAEFVGADVDFLDGACFEGHNGVFAGDGDEPIVPLTLAVSGDGVRLRRGAADAYAVPYVGQASLGAAFGDSVAARALRAGAGLPAEATRQNVFAHLRVAAGRLRDAAAAATQRGDTDTVLVLRHRLAQLTAAWWAFGAAVAWRLRLTGSDAECRTPSDFGPAATSAAVVVGAHLHGLRLRRLLRVAPRRAPHPRGRRGRTTAVADRPGRRHPTRRTGRHADRPHGRTPRPLARGEIDVRAIPKGTETAVRSISALRGARR